MGTITINTKAWHYKLWRFTFWRKDDELPHRTNLCAYVQRILWLTLPMALLLVLMTVVFGVSYTIGFLFAALWKLFAGQGRPVRFRIKEFTMERCFESYAPLRVGRVGLYPYHILVILVPLALVAALWWGFTSYPLETGAVVAAVVLSGVMLGVVWLFGRSRDTESYKLLASYLAAKKEKICPPVVFDRESKDEEDEV